MKKKMLSLIATIAAFALFVPSVMAAEPNVEKPLDKKGNEIYLFFANGTPITIEEAPDGEEGALIKWAGGEKVVPKNANVFGGSHDSTEVIESTSITMKGGTVRNIVGGGLHASNVESTYIEVNGGTVTYGITGGGASSFSGTTCHTWYAGDAEESTNRVDNANVVINAGDIYMVYGGSEGIGYTGIANVEINGGTYHYVTAGGSNGYTGTAVVAIYDGTVEVLQGVNRGSIDTTEIDVFGGTITNAYVGGETSDTSVDGTVADAYMYISGGEVANVSVGTSGGKAATSVAKLDYNEDVVENIDDAGFADENINTTVELTFIMNLESDPISVQVPQNQDLTELFESIKIEANVELEDFGYEIKGFYLDEELTTLFDGSNGIDEDTTVYIKIAEINEDDKTPVDDETKTDDETKEDESKEEEKSEEVLPPKTGDINLALLIGTIMLGVAGTILVSKKRLAKNN